MLWNIILIASLTLLLYAQTLKSGYVSDDLLSEGRRTAKPSQVAPEERVWQSSTSGNLKLDHGISIAVHAVCCIFIYTAMGADNIALFTALLFCVNPINNQGSVWISGRHYAWCALFLMMAKTTVLAGPFAMIAATVHPTALFAPLGFLGSPQWYLALFLPVIWLIHFKKLKKEVTTRRGHEVVDFDKKLTLAKFIIAIKIYGWYFVMCLVPWRLTWYHKFMQSGAGAGNEIMAERARKLDWPFWVGVGLIGYLIYSAIFNWTPISWGVFWYSCAIAPYLNIFRMQQEIAERYVYVANIGVMFALVNVIFWIGKWWK